MKYTILFAVFACLALLTDASVGDAQIKDVAETSHMNEYYSSSMLEAAVRTAGSHAKKHNFGKEKHTLKLQLRALRNKNKKIGIKVHVLAKKLKARRAPAWKKRALGKKLRRLSCGVRTP